MHELPSTWGMDLGRYISDLEPGRGCNHKRVYRIYCGLKLNGRRTGKKRLPSHTPDPLAVPAPAKRVLVNAFYELLAHPFEPLT